MLKALPEYALKVFPSYHFCLPCRAYHRKRRGRPRRHPAADTHVAKYDRISLHLVENIPLALDVADNVENAGQGAVVQAFLKLVTKTIELYLVIEIVTLDQGSKFMVRIV